MNDGRHKPLAIGIREQNGKARLHRADERVGGAEVDSDDDFRHARTVAENERKTPALVRLQAS